MGGDDLVKDLGAALIPPEDPHDPAIYRWRATVAIAIVILAGVMLMNILLTWGMLPVLFSGFALASDVAELKTQQVEIRASQIETQILDARERQCHAIKEGNEEAQRFALVRLQEKLALYRQVTRADYRLPGCDEL